MTTEFLTIDPSALDAVTGGRMEQGPKTASPKVQQALQQCSQQFMQGCQTIAQQKQSSQQNTMGMMQQLMQGGGGGHGGHGAG